MNAGDITESAAPVGALIAAGRAVMAKGLTWGTAGNISARLAGDAFLISASGVALDRLAPETLVRGDDRGAPGAGAPRPSVETGLHRAVYLARADVGAVLHASPFYATLVASSSLPVDANLTSDTAYYVGAVRRVPFAVPGSAALAEAVGAAASGGVNVLLLDNHGAVTLGATPAEAVTRLEALELLCRLLTYGALGVPLRPLGGDAVAALRSQLQGYGAAPSAIAGDQDATA